MAKRRKQHRRIDHWEFGRPVWTTDAEPRQHRPKPNIVKPVRTVVDGKVTVIADEVLKDVDKAFLIRIDGKTMWIAKSLLSEPDRKLTAEGDTLCELTIPEWLASKNDLL